MDLGCCVAPEQAATLAAACGDFAELSVVRAVMGGDDDAVGAAFARTQEALKAAGLPVRAYNVLLPAELALVGPAAEPQWLDTYLRTAFGRVRQLGGRIVVVGSGQARAIPQGVRQDAGLDQLAATLARMAAVAAEYDLTLALEPLRAAESNVFNTVGESATFLRERGLGDVRLLADLYHMMEEGEPLSALDGCADLLVHVHIADSGRRPPGQGDYPLADFFHHLRESGYAGDCSIECRWADFAAEIGPSLAYARRASRE